MSYENLLETIKMTRSIRRFKPDSIPDEYVDKVIEAARLAPSGFNSQPWEFVIIKDEGIKEKLVQMLTAYRGAHYPVMEKVRETQYGKPWKVGAWGPTPTNWSVAPVFIIMLGDNRTKPGLPMPVRFNREICDSIFTSSLAIAFSYMHMAAATLGLASQFVSDVKAPMVNAPLRHLLGIPGEMEIYDMMPLGYPAQKSRPKLLRQKDEMVHHDYCGNKDFRTEDDVTDFIRRTTYWVRATIGRSADDE